MTIDLEMLGMVRLLSFERCAAPDCDEALVPCDLAVLTDVGLMHESCHYELTGSADVAVSSPLARAA